MTDGGPLILSGSSINTMKRAWARAIRVDGCLVMPGPEHQYPSAGIHGKTGPGLPGRTVRMSRLALTVHLGHELPAGMWVLHRCDNRRCIDPHHLYLGTRADNVADMVERDRTGRRRHPEAWSAKSAWRSTWAKLSWDAVDEIRQQVAAGTRKSVLAKKYGVHRETIRRIAKVEIWKPEARP